jgi:hypothetical protein
METKLSCLDGQHAIDSFLTIIVKEVVKNSYSPTYKRMMGMVILTSWLMQLGS